MLHLYFGTKFVFLHSNYMLVDLFMHNKGKSCCCLKFPLHKHTGLTLSLRQLVIPLKVLTCTLLFVVIESFPNKVLAFIDHLFSFLASLDIPYQEISQL